MEFQHKINQIFCEQGDKVEIPATSEVEPSLKQVNLKEGFTPNYSISYYNGGVLIEREQLNGIFNKLYSATGELQEKTNTFEETYLEKTGQLEAKDAELENKITEKETALTNKINQDIETLKQEYKAADSQLDKKIDDTKKALQQEITNNSTETTEGINQAKQELQEKITAVETSLSSKVETSVIEQSLSGEAGKLPDSKAVKDFVLANAGTGGGGSTVSDNAFNYNQGENRLHYTKAEYSKLGQGEKSNGKLYLVEDDGSYKLYYNNILLLSSSDEVASIQWSVKLNYDAGSQNKNGYYALESLIPLIDKKPYLLHSVSAQNDNKDGQIFMLLKKGESIDSAIRAKYETNGTLNKNYQCLDDEILVRLTWKGKFVNSSYYHPSYLTLPLDGSSAWPYCVNDKENEAQFEVINTGNNLKTLNKTINGFSIVITDSWGMYAHSGTITVVKNGKYSKEFTYNKENTAEQYYGKYKTNKNAIGYIDIESEGSTITWGQRPL